MKTSGRKGGMDFDLRQLEIFCKVVELGSFSKAAEAVHLAQASVSERVATLERMVGTKLLDRIGREIVPNKAGELLYKRALKHLEIKRQTHHTGRVHPTRGHQTIPGKLPRYHGQAQNW
jgi:DNA-binding transcriptional LysR family regulator